MMRKPCVGDPVYIVQKGARRKSESPSGVSRTVAKIGKKYFYADDGTAYELDSYVDGYWTGKDYSCGCGSWAYLSESAFNGETEKRRLIGEIQRPDMMNFTL